MCKKLKVRIVYPCIQCGYIFSYGDLICFKGKTITCPSCGVEDPVYVSNAF